MLKFRNFISEEVIPTAQVEDGSIDLEKPAVRGQINATLAAVTSRPVVTPYVALHKIMKALAYFSIILPKKMYMQGDKGIEVYELKQFGHRMGMTDQGEFVHEVPATHYMFLQYRTVDPIGVTYNKPTVGGMYKVTAKVVDKAELDTLLSMAELTMSECWDKATMSQRKAGREEMRDLNVDSTESTKQAVGVSMRRKDKKLSAAELSEKVLDEPEPMSSKGHPNVFHPSGAVSAQSSFERMRKGEPAYDPHRTEIKRVDEERGDRITPEPSISQKNLDVVAKDFASGQGGASVVPRGDSTRQMNISPNVPERGNKFTNRAPLDEKAPPGAKFKRMVKHIKKSYSKGGLTDTEKAKAYGRAWYEYKKQMDEERRETLAQKAEKKEMSKIAKYAIEKGADIKRLPPGKKRKLEEVSKETLASYIPKAAHSASLMAAKRAAKGANYALAGQTNPDYEKSFKKQTMRHRGISTAAEKLAREETQLDELDRDMGKILDRYVGKTTDNPKRKEGRALALKKRWGDKKYGLPEPMVKAVDRPIKEDRLDELAGKGKAWDIYKHHAKAKENITIDDMDTKAREKKMEKKDYHDKQMKRAYSLAHGVREEALDEISKETLKSYREKVADKHLPGTDTKSFVHTRGHTTAGRKLGMSALDATLDTITKRFSPKAMKNLADKETKTRESDPGFQAFKARKRD